MPLTIEEKAVIERRVQYLGETQARLSGVKCRVKCAQHFIRRRERERAQEELIQLINEARRLHLHLQAWENYV